MVLISGRRWLQSLLSGWRLQVSLVLLETWRTEAARLSDMVGEASKSLWTMNKAKLVETVVEEFQYDREYAKGLTVIVLREKLRAYRAAMEVLRDPLSKNPPNLFGMRKEELLEEHAKRNLPQPERMTRPQLIDMIIQDVEHRQAVLEAELAATDVDWVDVEATGSATPKAKPKAEAKAD